jgi:hypothetical protein
MGQLPQVAIFFVSNSADRIISNKYYLTLIRNSTAGKKVLEGLVLKDALWKKFAKFERKEIIAT